MRDNHYIINYEKFHCRLILKNKYQLVKNNVYIWGYPYRGIEHFAGDWSESLNNICGYFFSVKVFDDKLMLGNDLLGGYRIYYIKIDKEYIFSDDYNILITYVKEIGKLTLDEDQFAYWKKHRVTLGDFTLFSQIKKVPPASALNIDCQGNLSIQSYYKDIPRSTDYSKLMKLSYDDIATSLKSVYQQNKDKKIVLFYSGGSDSTLLLHMLKELDIPFECIILKYSPKWSFNQADYCRAIHNAECLGVSSITEIEVDLNKALLNKDCVLDEMLFDRHVSVHFYEAYRVVAEKYGNNVVVINGQAADSVLCFGASDYTIGSWGKRLILYSKGIFRKSLYCIFYAVSRRYRIPLKKDDVFLSILDEHNYIFMKDMYATYNDALLDIIHEKKQKITNYEAQMMFFKIYSFLQGADNQIVIKAANHFGINHVIMPFTSPHFIYNVIQYKSNILDLFKPKYFIRDTLKKRYHYKSYYNQKYMIDYTDFDMSTYEMKILNEFYSRIKQIVR